MWLFFGGGGGVALWLIKYTPFTQGDDWQSSMSSSHLIPENPPSQLQIKPFTWSLQAPGKEEMNIWNVYVKILEKKKF